MGGNKDDVGKGREHEIAMGQLEAQSTTNQLGFGVVVSVGSDIDRAGEARTDAEWSSRANRRCQSPHDVAGPMRQHGDIACRKRDRAPEPAQLDDAGTFGDEVKRCPAVEFDRMIGGPLRAKPA